MLTRLSISNYALINELTVYFNRGLNSVTGETGAGKSIILGALGLILGNRADLSVLKNNTQKCIVEGLFEIGNYNLTWFFTENDLDYETQTIFRREITPAGKSRAFINDTPVTLKTIRELGLMLIDIHSQHQNLELSTQKFQLDLVDSVAGSTDVLQEYKLLFSEYNDLNNKLVELKEKEEKEKADLDYFQFQFNQLDEAQLNENEQEELEVELAQLTHSEDIKSALTQVEQLLNGEGFSLIQNLKEAQKTVEKVQNFLSGASQITERLQSTFFELKDILEEIEAISENVEFNPLRVEQVNDRLNLLYSLFQKHRVNSVKELIDLKNYFDQKIVEVESYSDEISKLEKQIEAHRKRLTQTAEKLSGLRKKSFAKIEKSVIRDLIQLGMEKSVFSIRHKIKDTFETNGRDQVMFYFSANPDSEPNEISKIASGGEMSRLMLAIKNLLRKSKALPTVIFDEIDSGISGEIALKMGTIIKSFAQSTQIINITHLPQIAAKGDAHFHVSKHQINGKTFTSIKELSPNERVEEIAKMVGGDNLTESTIKIAEELLAS